MSSSNSSTFASFEICFFFGFFLFRVSYELFGRFSFSIELSKARILFSLRNHHRISIRKLSKNFRFRVFESRKNHFVKCFFETDFALFENFFRNRVSMKISVFEFHFFVKSFFCFSNIIDRQLHIMNAKTCFRNMFFRILFVKNCIFFLYGKKIQEKNSTWKLMVPYSDSKIFRIAIS